MLPVLASSLWVTHDGTWKLQISSCTLLDLPHTLQWLAKHPLSTAILLTREKSLKVINIVTICAHQTISGKVNHARLLHH